MRVAPRFTSELKMHRTQLISSPFDGGTGQHPASDDSNEERLSHMEKVLLEKLSKFERLGEDQL